MDRSLKRPGRPPKAGGAMTQAQRQRAYRERQEQAMHDATINPKAATTSALLACLKHHCQSIDTQTDHADIARRLAAPVVAELCVRYKIK